MKTLRKKVRRRTISRHPRRPSVLKQCLLWTASHFKAIVSAMLIVAILMTDIPAQLISGITRRLPRDLFLAADLTGGDSSVSTPESMTTAPSTESSLSDDSNRCLTQKKLDEIFLAAVKKSLAGAPAQDRQTPPDALAVLSNPSQNDNKDKDYEALKKLNDASGGVGATIVNDARDKEGLFRVGFSIDTKAGTVEMYTREFSYFDDKGTPASVVFHLLGNNVYEYVDKSGKKYHVMITGNESTDLGYFAKVYEEQIKLGKPFDGLMTKRANAPTTVEYATLQPMYDAWAHQIEQEAAAQARNQARQETSARVPDYVANSLKEIALLRFDIDAVREDIDRRAPDDEFFLKAIIRQSIGLRDPLQVKLAELKCLDDFVRAYLDPIPEQHFSKLEQIILKNPGLSLTSILQSNLIEEPHRCIQDLMMGRVQFKKNKEDVFVVDSDNHKIVSGTTIGKYSDLFNNKFQYPKIGSEEDYNALLVSRFEMMTGQRRRLFGGNPGKMLTGMDFAAMRSLGSAQTLFMESMEDSFVKVLENVHDKKDWTEWTARRAHEAIYGRDGTSTGEHIGGKLDKQVTFEISGRKFTKSLREKLSLTLSVDDFKRAIQNLLEQEIKQIQFHDALDYLLSHENERSKYLSPNLLRLFNDYVDAFGQGSVLSLSQATWNGIMDNILEELPISVVTFGVGTALAKGANFAFAARFLGAGSKLSKFGRTVMRAWPKAAKLIGSKVARELGFKIEEGIFQGLLSKECFDVISNTWKEDCLKNIGHTIAMNLAFFLSGKFTDAIYNKFKGAKGAVDVARLEGSVAAALQKNPEVFALYQNFWRGSNKTLHHLSSILTMMGFDELTSQLSGHGTTLGSKEDIVNRFVNASVTTFGMALAGKILGGIIPHGPEATAPDLKANLDVLTNELKDLRVTIIEIQRQIEEGKKSRQGTSKQEEAVKSLQQTLRIASKEKNSLTVLLVAKLESELASLPKNRIFAGQEGDLRSQLRDLKENRVNIATEKEFQAKARELSGKSGIETFDKYGFVDLLTGTIYVNTEKMRHDIDKRQTEILGGVKIYMSDGREIFIAEGDVAKVKAFREGDSAEGDVGRGIVIKRSEVTGVQAVEKMSAKDLAAEIEKRLDDPDFAAKLTDLPKDPKERAAAIAKLQAELLRFPDMVDRGRGKNEDQSSLRRIFAFSERRAFLEAFIRHEFGHRLERAMDPAHRDFLAKFLGLNLNNPTQREIFEETIADWVAGKLPADKAALVDGFFILIIKRQNPNLSDAEVQKELQKIKSVGDIRGSYYRNFEASVGVDYSSAPLPSTPPSTIHGASDSGGIATFVRDIFDVPLFLNDFTSFLDTYHKANEKSSSRESLLFENIFKEIVSLVAQEITPETLDLPQHRVHREKFFKLLEKLQLLAEQGNKEAYDILRNVMTFLGQGVHFQHSFEDLLNTKENRYDAHKIQEYLTRLEQLLQAEQNGSTSIDPVTRKSFEILRSRLIYETRLAGNLIEIQKRIHELESLYGPVLRKLFPQLFDDFLSTNGLVENGTKLISFEERIEAIVRMFGAKSLSQLFDVLDKYKARPFTSEEHKMVGVLSTSSQFSPEDTRAYLLGLFFRDKANITNRYGKSMTFYRGKVLGQGGIGKVSHALAMDESGNFHEVVIKDFLKEGPGSIRERGVADYFMEKQKDGEFKEGYIQVYGFEYSGGLTEKEKGPENREKRIKKVRSVAFDLVRSADGTAKSMAEFRPKTPEELLIFLISLAERLQALHKKRIFFNDLKPANVLVDKDGKAVIIDLGAIVVDAPEIASDSFLRKELNGLPIIHTPNYAPDRSSRIMDDAANGKFGEHGIDLFSLSKSIANLMPLIPVNSPLYTFFLGNRGSVKGTLLQLQGRMDHGHFPEIDLKTFIDLLNEELTKIKNSRSSPQPSSSVVITTREDRARTADRQRGGATAEALLTNEKTAVTETQAAGAPRGVRAIIDWLIGLFKKPSGFPKGQRIEDVGIDYEQALQEAKESGIDEDITLPPPETAEILDGLRGAETEVETMLPKNPERNWKNYAKPKTHEAFLELIFLQLQGRGEIPEGMTLENFIDSSLSQKYMEMDAYVTPDGRIIFHMEKLRGDAEFEALRKATEEEGIDFNSLSSQERELRIRKELSLLYRKAITHENTHRTFRQVLTQVGEKGRAQIIAIVGQYFLQAVDRFITNKELLARSRRGETMSPSDALLIGQIEADLALFKRLGWDIGVLENWYSSGKGGGGLPLSMEQVEELVAYYAEGVRERGTKAGDNQAFNDALQNVFDLLGAGLKIEGRAVPLRLTFADFFLLSHAREAYKGQEYVPHEGRARGGKVATERTPEQNRALEALKKLAKGKRADPDFLRAVLNNDPLQIVLPNGEPATVFRVKKLGEGGFGVTTHGFRVDASGNIIEVAIKEFNPPKEGKADRGPDEVAMARHLLELQNPPPPEKPKLTEEDGIMQVDSISRDGKVVVYRRVKTAQGDSKDWKDYNKFSSKADVIRFFISLAKALNALRREGININDLKPQNIMVNEKGEAVIIDIGSWTYGSQPDLSEGLLGFTTKKRGYFIYSAEYAPRKASWFIKKFSKGEQNFDLYSLGISIELLIGETLDTEGLPKIDTHVDEHGDNAPWLSNMREFLGRDKDSDLKSFLSKWAKILKGDASTDFQPKKNKAGKNFGLEEFIRDLEYTLKKLPAGHAAADKRAELEKRLRAGDTTAALEDVRSAEEVKTLRGKAPKALRERHDAATESGSEEAVQVAETELQVSSELSKNGISLDEPAKTGLKKLSKISYDALLRLRDALFSLLNARDALRASKVKFPEKSNLSIFEKILDYISSLIRGMPEGRKQVKAEDAFTYLGLVYDDLVSRKDPKVQGKTRDQFIDEQTQDESGRGLAHELAFVKKDGTIIFNIEGIRSYREFHPERSWVSIYRELLTHENVHRTFNQLSAEKRALVISKLSDGYSALKKTLLRNLDPNARTFLEALAANLGVTVAAGQDPVEALFKEHPEMNAEVADEMIATYFGLRRVGLIEKSLEFEAALAQGGIDVANFWKLSHAKEAYDGVQRYREHADGGRRTRGGDTVAEENRATLEKEIAKAKAEVAEFERRLIEGETIADIEGFTRHQQAAVDRLHTLEAELDRLLAPEKRTQLEGFLEMDTGPEDIDSVLKLIAYAGRSKEETSHFDAFVKGFTAEFSQFFPEWQKLIGEGAYQHAFHDYKLGVHMIKVLFEMRKTKKYQSLSKADQRIAHMVALLHDMAKETGTLDQRKKGKISPDPAHPLHEAERLLSDGSLQKLGFSEAEAERIIRLIKYHDAVSNLALYGEGNAKLLPDPSRPQIAAHTYERVGKAFEKNPEDLDILEGFVEGDIKGVQQQDLWNLRQMDKNLRYFTVREKVQTAFKKVRALSRGMEFLPDAELRALEENMYNHANVEQGRLVTTKISPRERQELTQTLRKKLQAARVQQDTQLVSILEEALQYVQSESAFFPIVSHGTNSVALQGILREGALKSAKTLQEAGLNPEGGEGAKFGGQAASPNLFVGLGEAGAGTAFAYAQVKQTVFEPRLLTTAQLEARSLRTRILIDNFLQVGSDLSRKLMASSPNDFLKELQREKQTLDALIAERKKVKGGAEELPFGVIIGLQLDPGKSQQIPVKIMHDRQKIGPLAAEATLPDHFQDGSMTLPFPPAEVFVPAEKVASVKEMLGEKYPHASIKVHSFESVLLAMGNSPIRDAFMESYKASLDVLTRNSDTREEQLNLAVSRIKKSVSRKNVSDEDFEILRTVPLPDQHTLSNRVPWNNLFQRVDQLPSSPTSFIPSIRQLVDALQPSFSFLSKSFITPYV